MENTSDEGGADPPGEVEEYAVAVAKRVDCINEEGALEEDVHVYRYVAYDFEFGSVEQGIVGCVNTSSKDVVVLGGDNLVGDEFCERMETNGEAIRRRSTNREDGGVFYTDMVDGVSEEIIERSSFREDDAEEGADISRVWSGARTSGGGWGNAKANFLDRNKAAYVEA